MRKQLLILFLLVCSVPIAASCNKTDPQPDERKIANLRALAKVYGYVRYFYPARSFQVADWDRFLLTTIPNVEAATSDEELANVLIKHFQELAPALRITTSSTMSSPTRDTTVLQLSRWEHFGLEASNNSTYSSNVVSKATSSFDSIPWNFGMLSRQISPTLYAHWPLVLDANDTSVVPSVSTAMEVSNRYGNGIPPDRITWIAGIIQTWNAFQHFYPYFDVVNSNWDAALTEALNATYVSKNFDDHYVNLQQLTAKVQDGHVRVWGRNSYPYMYSPPMVWEIVENKLVVVQADSGSPLQVGDVIEKINGRPAEVVMKERASEISSATKQWENYRVASSLRMYGRDSILSLTVIGEKEPVVFSAVPQLERVEESHGPKIREVKPDIWYVDLSVIATHEFDSIKGKLAKAKGVIFDMRGYPDGLEPSVLGYLTDKPVSTARWHIPMITEPDRKNISFDFSNWSIQPMQPRIKGKVAFLTNGSAISYAETLMGIVEHYRLGAIVGEPTAGTNGNVNILKIAGGYSVSFTGMKVLKHDGSQHHGIGIVPTHPVKRTIAGVRAGRDEFLEKAIEVVSE